MSPIHRSNLILSHQSRPLAVSLIMLGLICFGSGLFTGTGALFQNVTPVSAASDPVIAAAGDIACDPTDSHFNNGNGTSSACRQKYTSDLLVNAGLAAVLDLGDNQYYCGGYQAFVQSYDLSWGRVKSITHPSVGNHEYLTSGGTGCDSSNANAAGYFQYFGAAAGIGYYSFDIGTWHIISLDSNCSSVGGCGASSPQGKWLEADLTAHTNFCTLAFWHIPLYSSGGRANGNTQSFWNALYSHNADLILTGHDHIYERFAPQNPSAGLDTARGIREFIIGTGGADHTTIVNVAANSEVRNASTFGVIKLTLHPTSYDWQFVPEAGKTFTDSGTQACHGTTPPSPTATATSTPTTISTATATPTTTRTGSLTPTATLPAATLFSDGFESGNLANWTTVSGLVVQNQVVASGSFAARGSTARGAPTYARKRLSTPQTDLYYRIQFNVVSQAANTVNLMKFRTASGRPLLSVSVNNLFNLSYRDDTSGATVNTTVAVGMGTWQTLEVHLRITSTTRLIEIWYNHVLVSSNSGPATAGITSTGWVQLGENTPGLTYDIAFDNAVVATGFIP